MRGSKNSLRATDAQIQAQGVSRGAHLTLSVGERGWSEFVRASRHQKMALQRSSERNYSNHLLGLTWRRMKKTLK